MYNIGDYLVYKRDVCKVVSIKENYYKGNTYYELVPILDNTLKNLIPINNKFIRNVITKDEALKIIDQIKDIKPLDISDKQIENEYKKLLDSNNHMDLIKIIKTTYLRNKKRLDEKRKISEKDKNYFDKAEKILYSEFSIALNKSYDDTKTYIIDHVNSITNVNN